MSTRISHRALLDGFRAGSAATGTRELVVQRPCAIAYRIVAATIEILRVRHSAQDSRPIFHATLDG